MVICPHCGNEVRARARLGEGTQKAKVSKINENRRQVLIVIRDLKKTTIQQILNELNRKHVKRISKTRGWNYHTVQVDVSMLLGGNHIRMIRPQDEEYFDEDEGFITIKLPKYALAKRL